MMAYVLESNEIISLRKKEDQGVNASLSQLFELRHPNILPFLAASLQDNCYWIAYEYCSKGNLESLLLNHSLELPMQFRCSIASDIARGMEYIRNSVFGFHGYFSSRACFVNTQWVCKIGGFGIREFGLYQMWSSCQLYTAPENLENNSTVRFNATGDVYSLGVVLLEVFTRTLAEEFFADNSESIFRNEFTTICDSTQKTKALCPIVLSSISKDPLNRPNISHIRAVVCATSPESRSIVEYMSMMLENYTKHLEEMVADRTCLLDLEKQKFEELLYQLIPQKIAKSLAAGEQIEAENFEMVTIFFSDIVGFTAISAESTPMQIVAFLNALYTCFDSIISSHDVYKVETIGDAYMVVSGLPERNGDAHAGHICDMALNLLAEVALFKIPHRPNDQLQLRIGIHSGPCCAGVVGLKMPRYCLFGDTVNTASRLESTSMALRIHVSSTTANILSGSGIYILEARGEVEMKGKGKMSTFWLTGAKNFSKKLPDLSLALSAEYHSFK